MRGMNFSEVDESALATYISDPDWWIQQKLDGTRVLVKIRRDLGTIDFMARDGNPLKHTAAMQHFDALRDALHPLVLSNAYMLGHTIEIWLDAELLIREGTLHVFDLPALWNQAGENVIDGRAYALRFHWLSDLVLNLDPDNPVQRVVTARQLQAKRDLVRFAREMGVEGVVLKHRKNVYQPGERVKDILKVKFVKTADVVVMNSTRGRNAAGRETGSFQFGIYDPDNVLANDAGYVPFGSCSAIGKPEVGLGDVIEVAYLYRDPDGGGLVQPRMVRVRADKKPVDCTIDQFPLYSREVI